MSSVLAKWWRNAQLNENGCCAHLRRGAHACAGNLNRLDATGMAELANMGLVFGA